MNRIVDDGQAEKVTGVHPNIASAIGTISEFNLRALRVLRGDEPPADGILLTIECFREALGVSFRSKLRSTNGCRFPNVLRSLSDRR